MASLPFGGIGRGAWVRIKLHVPTFPPHSRAGPMPRLPLETRLAAAWPPESWQDLTVLMAVSGGADSVGLLRALTALKTAGSGRLAIAHFNHHLRPEAGDEAQFVADLAAQLSLDFELGVWRVAEAPAYE